MSIELNETAYKLAEKLIQGGRVDTDHSGDWDSVNPDSEAQNHFIEKHGYEEYGAWHLGIKADGSRNTKGDYSFPYGDFQKVYRSGLIAAEERAAQYHHEAVRQAAAQLLAMIDEA